MPGLNLQVRGRASGTYSPMTPGVAQPPSTAGMTIGNLAYGVSGDGASPRPYAAIGAMCVAAASLGLLAFLWYSLPR